MDKHNHGPSFIIGVVTYIVYAFRYWRSRYHTAVGLATPCT